MYAVYNYQPNSTTANVLSDLVALLTGTTDPASLSSDCVTGNTSVTALDAAGWEVYDNDTGTTDRVILRALSQDGIVYNYVQLTLTTTTLNITTMESWNSATNTATNYAYSQGFISTISTNGGGYFYIYATSKNILIKPWITEGMQTLVNACEINPYGFFYTGYPRMGVYNGGGPSAYWPRVKRHDASGDSIGFSVSTRTMTGASSNYASGSLSSRYRLADESEILQLSKLYPLLSNNPSYMVMGELYDILTGGTLNIILLDEIVYNGVNYVYLESSVPRFVPKR